MIWRNLGVLCSAVLSLGLAQGLQAAQSLPARTLGEAKVTWNACPLQAHARVKCGELEAPENWRADRSSRRIRVSFAVVSAAEAKRRKEDPIVFFTGGPGVSAFQYLSAFAAAPLSNDRDVIVIEPRGYGYSNPALICDGGLERLSACRTQHAAAGIDLGQYDTEAFSHDAEALRLALRITRWNVYGVSFGSFWGLQYTRFYPEGIRALILDSPHPPQASYEWTRPSALNAFERVFDSCKADAACDKAYPDLRARFIAALRRAEKEPIKIEGRASMRGGQLFEHIYKQLYDSPTLARTPMLIDRAAKGEFEQLFASDAHADMGSAIDSSRRFAAGLNASVVCADVDPFPATLDTRVAFKSVWPKDIVQLIRPEGWNYATICADWPVEKSPELIHTPVSSDIPSLILVGAYDPITPPEFAEAMALTLSRSTVFVDPSSSHAVLTAGHECAWRAVLGFLSDPVASIDKSCIWSIPPVAWTLPRATQ